MFKKSAPFHFSAVAGAVLASFASQNVCAQDVAINEKQIEATSCHLNQLKAIQNRSKQVKPSKSNWKANRSK